MSMSIKIWDDHNKQWLKPTAIYFDSDGKIHRVSAMKLEHTDSLRDGWYTIIDEDLKKIAITGEIEHNLNLLPK